MFNDPLFDIRHYFIFNYYGFSFEIIFYYLEILNKENVIEKNVKYIEY